MTAEYSSLAAARGTIETIFWPKKEALTKLKELNMFSDDNGIKLEINNIKILVISPVS